jgi:hypothetical protein
MNRLPRLEDEKQEEDEVAVGALEGVPVAGMIATCGSEHSCDEVMSDIVKGKDTRIREGGGDIGDEEADGVSLSS